LQKNVRFGGKADIDHPLLTNLNSCARALANQSQIDDFKLGLANQIGFSEFHTPEELGPRPRRKSALQ
jgi:hypothetical protein